ncbi:hypothetical protein Fot_32255 [Forsythia ovata]|uniref:Uncharacterized protein n=1 Tax=Forsythia ovata TaxID=205694 RepID=A0ABD1T7U2_9LAMI
MGSARTQKPGFGVAHASVLCCGLTRIEAPQACGVPNTHLMEHPLQTRVSGVKVFASALAFTQLQGSWVNMPLRPGRGSRTLLSVFMWHMHWWRHHVEMTVQLTKSV